MTEKEIPREEYLGQNEEKETPQNQIDAVRIKMLMNQVKRLKDEKDKAYSLVAEKESAIEDRDCIIEQLKADIEKHQKNREELLEMSDMRLKREHQAMIARIEGMSFCPNCGKEMTDNDHFCEKCKERVFVPVYGCACVC